MLHALLQLLPLETTTTIMVALGVAALFIITLLLVRPRRKVLVAHPGKPHEAIDIPTRGIAEVPPIPRSDEGAEAAWFVLDLQTTGLSTVRGHEDLIVEATWLLLDREYRLMRQEIVRVRQSYSGSEEARQVHELSEYQLVHHGISEGELVEKLMADLEPGTTIVMHNADFDLAILRGTMARVAPERLGELHSHPTLCTMTYIPTEHYPSLVTLTTSITTFTEAQFRAPRPISYRNAYFTRACLIALKNSIF